MWWIILFGIIIMGVVIYWRKQKFKIIMEEAIQYARQHGNVPLDYSAPLFNEFKIALNFLKNEQLKTIPCLTKIPLSAQYGWSIINCYLIDLAQNQIIDDFIDQPELTEEERANKRTMLIEQLHHPELTRGQREETLYHAKHLALFHEDLEMQKMLAQYYQDQEDYKNAIIFYGLASEHSDDALYQSHVLLNTYPDAKPDDLEMELLSYNFMLTQYRNTLPFLPKWREHFTHPESIHLSWGSATSKPN